MKSTTAQGLGQSSSPLAAQLMLAAVLVLATVISCMANGHAEEALSVVKALRAGQPSTNTLSSLPDLARSSSNATESAVLWACYSAGMLVVQQPDKAKAAYDEIKRLAPQSTILREFSQEALQDPCQKCGGSGVSSKVCTFCPANDGQVGNGACFLCKGVGTLTYRDTDGMSYTGPCGKCGGKKKCPQCKGTGRIPVAGTICGTCGGAGRVASRTKIAELYKRRLSEAEAVFSGVSQGRGADWVNAALTEPFGVLPPTAVEMKVGVEETVEFLDNKIRGAGSELFLQRLGYVESIDRFVVRGFAGQKVVAAIIFNPADLNPEKIMHKSEVGGFASSTLLHFVVLYTTDGKKAVQVYTNYGGKREQLLSQDSFSIRVRDEADVTKVGKAFSSLIQAYGGEKELF